MSKLTNTQIKNARGKEKPYSLGDGLGLSVLINSNGSKWWRYRFQFNGKAKMMSLGTYPDVSLAQARERLMEARRMVADGVNPVEVKQNHQHGDEQEEHIVTFKEVGDLYLTHLDDQVAINELSEAHYIRSERLLRLYATPALGDMAINEITFRDLRDVIVALNGVGKKETAIKMHSLFGKLFAHAINHNYCEVNPARLLEMKEIMGDHEPTHFSTITEPAEVKRLLDNIRSVENGHWSTKYGLLLMAYTSLRSANVRKAQWSYIDFEKKLMTIPKKEMKIKKVKLNNAEDFRLPLADQTIALLQEVQKLSGHGKYIFPSIRGDRPMSENAMLVLIRSLDYTKDEFTPHGFRAMFATVANDESNDFDRDLIDAQLAHKVGDRTSQSYNRGDYLNRRIELSQWWADWLDSL